MTQSEKILSDEQIIKLYFQRNEEAITETDNKYGNFLFRIAFNILHDRSDSEECKNDTYLGIWNAIPPTRPSVFPAFITRIIRNISLDRYKRKASKKRIPSELTVAMEDLSDTLKAENTVETEYEQKELARLISDFVRALPRRRRYIFIGRFYMADSIEYIATELNVSVPTVYRELDKVKKDLYVYLREKGVKS